MSDIQYTRTPPKTEDYLNKIYSAVSGSTVSGGTLEQIKNADDYNLTVNWVDIDTTDQRPISLVHNSVALGLTVTETFTWSGSSGNYYLTNITIS